MSAENLSNREPSSQKPDRVDRLLAAGEILGEKGFDAKANEVLSQALRLDPSLFYADEPDNGPVVNPHETTEALMDALEKQLEQYIPDKR